MRPVAEAACACASDTLALQARDGAIGAGELLGEASIGGLRAGELAVQRGQFLCQCCVLGRFHGQTLSKLGDLVAQNVDGVVAAGKC